MGVIDTAAVAESDIAGRFGAQLMKCQQLSTRNLVTAFVRFIIIKVANQQIACDSSSSNNLYTEVAKLYSL
eukprot:5299188-Pleurochrysis_carterae.AAC.1